MTPSDRPVWKGMRALTEHLPGGCRLIELKLRGDDRGSLVAIEAGIDAPFAILRAYYVFGTGDGVVRGLHAHRQLRQLAVSVSGACTMLIDDGKRRAEVRLDRPDQGLLMGAMVWREMHDFSPDCVLLVLADSAYDERDYIRNYAAFCREARLWKGRD